MTEEAAAIIAMVETSIEAHRAREQRTAKAREYGEALEYKVARETLETFAADIKAGRHLKAAER